MRGTVLEFSADKYYNAGYKAGLAIVRTKRVLEKANAVIRVVRKHRAEDEEVISSLMEECSWDYETAKKYLTDFDSDPNAVTLAAMDAAEKGEDMYGPYNNSSEVMDALNSDHEEVIASVFIRMKYRNHFAEVNCYEDEQDGSILYHGKVIGTDDLITFGGKTLKEAKQDFRNAIDKLMDE